MRFVIGILLLGSMFVSLSGCVDVETLPKRNLQHSFITHAESFSKYGGAVQSPSVRVDKVWHKRWQERGESWRVSVKAYRMQPIQVFYFEDEYGVHVFATLPEWVAPPQSAFHCVLTDRSPEFIAENWRPRNLQPLFTLKGINNVYLSRGVRPRLPALLEVRATDMPQKGWLACKREIDDPAPGMPGMYNARSSRKEVNLYPVEFIHKKTGTLEILYIKRWQDDFYLKFRVFPPPSYHKINNLRLDLVTYNPPTIKKDGQWIHVVPMLYYGFNEDPSRDQYRYSIGISSYQEDGRKKYYTVFYSQSDTFEFEVFGRLVQCKLSRPQQALAVSHQSCNSLSLVQAFYTHDWFLHTLGIPSPVRLKVQLISPDGWRSEPFYLTLGGEQHKKPKPEQKRKR